MTALALLHSHPVQLRCPLCDAALLGSVGDEAIGPHMWCPRFYCSFRVCIGEHSWSGYAFPGQSYFGYTSSQCGDCGQPFHGPLVPPWLFPELPPVAVEGLPPYVHECDYETCCS